MYEQLIREALAEQGAIGKYDPRHIEAFMRLEHSTLDGLSRGQFASEVSTARVCIDEGGRDGAESLARSYGP